MQGFRLVYIPCSNVRKLSLFPLTCLKLLCATFCPLQVIYELTQGERQLIEDLSLVKKVLVGTEHSAGKYILARFFLVSMHFYVFRCTTSPC